MVAKTEVISIRLPDDLLDKLDETIEKIGFSNSRAEYIVSSMDRFFRELIATRLKIDREIEQFKNIQGIDPNTILSITTAGVKRYMEKYDRYTGKKRQVLLRPPVKLIEAIDEFQPHIGLYGDRSDFIRYAVSLQIETDESLVENMERVSNHRVFQTRSTEDIVNSVMQKLNAPDSSAMDGLVNLTNLLINESVKPKDQ